MIKIHIVALCFRSDSRDSIKMKLHIVVELLWLPEDDLRSARGAHARRAS